ncbi:uncharacterized protein Z518_00783 [Rhinocladiella mackenziei CBS 650.93]|uniref:Rhinocladiella mackenziei CBS 650.93 unplaced genomic scaffold supercont1.1, whole genome shotgun sequence n=1 Tax=Rhinocladiella mackenziei CBS 650.93 TaxID=1442369 RepID=A0A0D2G4Q5_9EURO|nr:uncharacterized protein Z518_00783 [Rhinocladiella mackenziei CBS 650.93]KIX09702.1 hypothetical protein Z518_00783 [Rhinocladiella mackenziei CBS 650.93]
MPEENRKDTAIPPPYDPFPTYQAPYPRSNKDDENPFIQFRRFADEQFSSFFQGVPHMFGFSPRNAARRDDLKKDFEDLIRRRHELEEGCREQLEREMEEMRQTLKQSQDHRTTMENAWNFPNGNASWWTHGRVAQRPALNGEEPQKKCPALYDDAGNPKTELDVYEGIQGANSKQVQAFQPPVQDASKKSSRSWFSALGWDGKQMEKGVENDKAVSDNPSSDKEIARPTKYTMFNTRRMDPFDDTNHTIPWLMLSPYSPIYLCNPSQSRLFKVQIQDSEDTPLRISRPRFFERWYSDVDEKMAEQVPWADAFEDLVSLQQTGKMVDRDSSTWRTPNTWIHDMVNRGSLGSRWGFDDEGLLVKRHVEQKTTDAPSTMKDRCTRPKERGWGWGCHRRCEKSTGDEQQHSLQLGEKEKDLIDDLVDKATSPLTSFPLFGSILSAADAIVSAVDQAQKELEEISEEASPDDGSEPAPAAQEPTTSSYSATSSSSSSYEDSFSSFPSSDGFDPSKSVIATLTSTVTRTLPDGSIETKRVLKRRFADGSEESDESVEMKNLPSTHRTNDAKDSVETRNPSPTLIQAQWPEPRPTARPVQDAIAEHQQKLKIEQQDQKEARAKRSGWFWT